MNKKSRNQENLHKIKVQTIKKGYKQTEVGVIPEDWETKKLGDICVFYNGIGHEQFEVAFGKYIIVNSKFISTESKVFRTTEELLSPLKKDDIAIVMSDIPNGKALAKCFIIDSDNKYTLNQRIGGITIKSNCSKYYFYLLSRNPYFLSFDSGSGQTNLRKQEILDCPIVVPPIQEQQAIAQVLSDTDQLIQSLKTLIAKKKAIKQGAMQELLTGKKRLQGFTEEWETKKLGEVLSYEQPPKYIINSEILEKGKTPVLTANKSFVLGYTNEDFGIFTNTPVVIFDDFTTLNKYVDFNFKIKSSAIKILRNNADFSLKFLYNRMQLIEHPLGDHKRYYISEYQNIEIEVPSLKEQQAIAQILSDMDAEIEALAQQLQKTQTLKQGMMQELLTGKTRLVKPATQEKPQPLAMVAEPQKKYN